MEHHLQQQVAQLVLQGRIVLAIDRVRDLVTLLDTVRRDGVEGLHDIPRAALLASAQARHDAEQCGDFVAHPRNPSFASQSTDGSPSARNSGFNSESLVL